MTEAALQKNNRMGIYRYPFSYLLFNCLPEITLHANDLYAAFFPFLCKSIQIALTTNNPIEMIAVGQHTAYLGRNPQKSLTFL